MITFVVSIVLLLLGYFVYSKFIANVIGVDSRRRTPVKKMEDGVDYVPMKPWRIFLIQFLNIAGIGPIIGAVMGAQFGTASFLWIVLGSIFAGAVHDFVAGFISVKYKGCSLPEIVGRHLGKGSMLFMRIFTIFLMVLVGAVFVSIPAELLQGQFTPNWNPYIWVIIIFGYYLLATLLPIDKVIGKIYPVFGILLLLMAVFVVCGFFRPEVHLLELWEGLENQHPQAATNPIFPMMFISIACGAISGFHATQSPMMARCMTDEKYSRPIFYGAMITEGIVALIWAAAAAYFFNNVDTQGAAGAGMVQFIAKSWFTPLLATITILGVIAAAVTSGDTALRSARLILADFLGMDQKPIYKRLLIALPIFLASAGLLIYSNKDEDGFQMIWRYFAWANQVLATITLWAVSVFIFNKRFYTDKYRWSFLITLIPALFMTMVVSSFIFVAQKEGFGLPRPLAYGIGGAITLLAFLTYFALNDRRLKARHKQKKTEKNHSAHNNKK